jgi:hypothetical protein
MSPGFTSGLPFGAASDEDKINTFQRSTLDKFLVNLGWAPAAVRSARDDVGDSGWGFEWFNAQGILPFVVTATRVFEFNLAEAFFHPKKSALLVAYAELKELQAPDSDFAMIFKVYEWGLLVATSREIPGAPHIHIPGTPPVAIAALKEFCLDIKELANDK